MRTGEKAFAKGDYEGALRDAVMAADLRAPFVQFERAGADVAKDYAAYRILSRDRLLRYIVQFWCGIEPTPEEAPPGSDRT